MTSRLMSPPSAVAYGEAPLHPNHGHPGIEITTRHAIH
jgi:hypothetical protein